MKVMKHVGREMRVLGGYDLELRGESAEMARRRDERDVGREREE